jgi:RNA polymerase sigma-70 factor (ECF subfamily)
VDHFETELEAHVRGLRRYAIALTGSPPDADDLVQETLRRAIDYGGNRARVRDWRSYLFRILHNVRNDQLSRLARMPEQRPIDGEDGFDIPSPPSQEILVDCLNLQRALDAMPDIQKQVVLLAGLQGFSYKEVAELLDIPIGTVMSRLCRGREFLRQAMELPAQADRARRTR